MNLMNNFPQKGISMLKEYKEDVWMDSVSLGHYVKERKKNKLGTFSVEELDWPAQSPDLSILMPMNLEWDVI